MSTSTSRTSLDGTPSRRGRVGRRALTALRVLLAIEFAGAGLMKLGGAGSMVTLFADIGAGQWLRYVVGALELAGAIGLLIPPVAGLAAVGLAGLMTGAFVTHAVVLDGTPAIEALFLVATAAIAYHRRAEIRSLATRVLRRAPDGGPGGAAAMEAPSRSETRGLVLRPRRAGRSRRRPAGLAGRR
jgi:putative oxidoreductase